MSAIPRAADRASARTLPPTGDLDALAEHFDTTDVGGLPWNESEEVLIERPELEQLSLRLPREDLAALKRRAARAGVGYTTLIRMIVRQYLHNPLLR